MIKSIGNWVSSIAIAVIIVTILETILPEGKNKKYIKTVLGIFLLFSIISPVIKAVTGDNFNLNQLESANAIKYENNIGINTSQSIEELFIANIKKDISSRLKEKGYIVNKITISADIQEGTNDAKIQEIGVVINKQSSKTIETGTIETVEISIGNTGLKKELSNENTITENEKEKIIEYLSTTYDVQKGKITIKEG